MKKTSMSSSRAAQIAAVKELREYNHAFLPKDIVRKLVKPFGLAVQTSTQGGPNDLCPARTPVGAIETYVECHNPHGGKHGVTLPKDMAFMEGSDAEYLARVLCYKLNVDYKWSWGRGSGLRNCCDALLTYLNRLA